MLSTTLLNLRQHIAGPNSTQHQCVRACVQRVVACNAHQPGRPEHGTDFRKDGGKLRHGATSQATQSGSVCWSAMLWVPCVQDFRLTEMAAAEGRAVVVVVNKWDKVDQRVTTEEMMIDDVRAQLRHVSWASVVCTTAHKGQCLVCPAADGLPACMMFTNCLCVHCRYEHTCKGTIAVLLCITNIVISWSEALASVLRAPLCVHGSSW